jgi:hypothetical protein
MRWNFGSGPRGTALILTFCGVLLISGNASGQGGPCPTGANYLNAATNSLVTLASLGVTNCYYISARGSDSNAGTSESSPWLHAPQMPNCSGNCATVQNAKLPAGTGLIFRGGDAWHFGDSTQTTYTGGTWGFNVGKTPSGTLSNPIYLGVDQSWYSGSSWARPILTGDNPTSTSTTLGPCAYQIGSNNNMLNFSGSGHFILDNFELTGFCQQTKGAPNGWDQYISYGNSTDMRFLNLYVHGWTHEQFGNPADPMDCGPTNNYICINTEIFRGGDEPDLPDDVFRYIVVDGSDSDPTGAMLCYCDFWDVAYSYFGNQSSVNARYPHLYHDNLYEYWYENGHGDVIQSVGDAPGTNAFYNSVFRHINVPNAAGDPMLCWTPHVGTTDYVFNDVVYDIGNMEYFIMGDNNRDVGAFAVFNDVFQSNSNSTNGTIFGCSATRNASSYTNANNLYIIDTAVYPSSGATNTCKGHGTETTSLQLSNSKATSDGYTASGTYAYFPPSVSSPTVKAGTNEKNNLCSALSTAASSDSSLSDAVSACLSDTRYACTYNRTNHTLTCPGRTAVARPSSGNWDIGAYQFGNAVLAPPTNLQATVH